MRTFLQIWIGQLISILGSEMTTFAVTLWVWDQTGKATPLALVWFFSRASRVIAASFAGLIVDSVNRKHLMILGDTMAGLSTLVLLLLLWSNQLAIWHLYITAFINGFFGYLQSLAYSASESLFLPKLHYARATALNHFAYSGNEVIAPAMAGLLYPLVGISGIFIIDFFTFVAAVSLLLSVQIPQPNRNVKSTQDIQTLRQKLTFGFRYIFSRSSLVAILVFLLGTNLVFYISGGIYSPMILARSHDSAIVLASVQTAAGIGGVVGSAVLSIWGGPQPRIHGVLGSAILVGSSSMLLGLGKTQVMWMLGSFLSAFFLPLRGSSNQAIWLSKVDPSLQGRVFASRYLIAQIASPLGLLLAGIFADYVFTPVMTSEGGLIQILAHLFGSESGSGMALQYTLFSCLGVLIGVGGYAFPTLRHAETILPDYDRSVA
jgi:MFS family permease